MFSERPNTVQAGVGLAFKLHLFQFASIVLGGFPLLFFGLTQWAYLTPAIIEYRKRGQAEVVKGLVIVGAVGFLLNAGCFGLVFLALSGADFR